MNEVEASSQLDWSGEYPVVNMSGLSDELVATDDNLREIAGRLSKWVDNARNASGRSSMFDRGAYTPPDNPYDEMVVARRALAYDDIVAGVSEITESFAFGGVKWESEDPDASDVFNQISRDLHLDELLRKQWREVYAYSTYVCVMSWGWKTYKLRGKTKNGNKKKGTKRVWCPVDIRVIDPTKVVPVRSGPMGPDLLAWCSTNGEVAHYRRAFSGEVIDPQMVQFYSGIYHPTQVEERELSALGVDTENLLLLNPDRVWRFTLTKADYERFADVRLKSVFRLLDMKQQLMAADRAMLVGAANYLLLIRKGDNDRPAKPEEMRNLKENYQFIAKLPVIISDHRLQVDIIAPKQDFTLQGERYDVLDMRLLARLLGTLTFSSRGQRNETNVTLSKSVAKAMQNRRHMMARELELHIARKMLEHPRNEGLFDHEPNLVFTPRNISLDIDASTIQALVGLRASREMSRETILEYFGLDQAAEAMRRELEAEQYDDIFQTAVPFSGPQPPQVTGPQGGRPAGGGDSPENTTKPKAQTPKGNPSTAGD